MVSTTQLLATDEAVVRRVREHIAAGTTDLADVVWSEPVEHYLSEERFASELDVLRSVAVPFCPSAALGEAGSFVARSSVGVPVVATRAADGSVRAFRNTCRHRGAAVVCGAGNAASLVCPYHGWVYQLDGRLRRVPDQYGFPGIDLEVNGLVPLPAFERHGLVFVGQQDGVEPAAEIDELAGVVTPDFVSAGATESELPVNWKLLVETFLEGYHIRFLHHGTFFPVQYDNVNVVESFGPNSRITFPFRNIERPFDIGDALAVRGRLTYVHHLFPNVMLATFPGRVLLIVLDPITIDRTNVITYGWRHADALTADGAPNLLNDGAAEDFAVARTIQFGLASGANQHLRFGRFEGAITHFHRTLDHALADVDVR